jgi:hypothetical protein
MYSNSIAGYFLSEMEGWQDSLEFHGTEILRSEELLKVIIQMNTIPDLSNRVDHFFVRLKAIHTEMTTLEEQIASGEEELMEDEEPVSNDAVSEAMSLRQKEFRDLMHILENRYLELKYECDGFVAETLVVQNRKSS